MLRKCRQHRYELSAQVQMFYNGLNYSMRALINMVSGGLITSKDRKRGKSIV